MSRCRDHRVEPRQSKSAAKASVDAISDDERQTTAAKRYNDEGTLLRGFRRSSRESRSRQIGRARIVRRRVESDVSIVLLV